MTAWPQQPPGHHCMPLLTLDCCTSNTKRSAGSFAWGVHGGLCRVSGGLCRVGKLDSEEEAATHSLQDFARGLMQSLTEPQGSPLLISQSRTHSCTSPSYSPAPTAEMSLDRACATNQLSNTGPPASWQMHSSTGSSGTGEWTDCRVRMNMCPRPACTAAGYASHMLLPGGERSPEKRRPSCLPAAAPSMHHLRPLRSLQACLKLASGSGGRAFGKAAALHLLRLTCSRTRI